MSALSNPEQSDPLEEKRQEMHRVLLIELENLDMIERMLWQALNQKNKQEYQRLKRAYRKGLRRYFNRMTQYIMKFGTCPPIYCLYCAQNRLIPIRRPAVRTADPAITALEKEVRRA